LGKSVDIGAKELGKKADIGGQRVLKKGGQRIREKRFISGTKG
jgi:hypothetical protein